MKIALIGYGKMGKTIERIAIERGHTIILKITSAEKDKLTFENLQQADVCIEFSKPESAFNNIEKCLSAGVPTVCGTTAWTEKLKAAEDLCLANNTSFIFASNFSLGVNLFFAVNAYLARLMAPYPNYAISMEEIHHTAKLDAPSGTAVTIANDILDAVKHKTNWVNHASTVPHELGIVSKRIDPAPGTHSVKYSSTIDDIEITHTAHSRDGFAFGAVLAAEYIYNKKGIFTMQDVLQIK